MEKLLVLEHIILYTTILIIYFYLEKDNGKLLKFHISKSSYFAITPSPY